MTQPPSGDDPVVRALDELVRSGQLAPERARAAYDASRGSGPPPTQPMAPPTEESASAEPPGGMRLDIVAVALGVALVATTIVLSSVYSRRESDLDWSNFGLGLIATLGLLGVAAGAYLLVKDDDSKVNLIAWPGALGALGAGLMIGVAMDDSAATGYVSGLVTAAISAGGFFLFRRGAFVVTAVVGLFVTYANLVDDVFDVDGGNSDNLGMKLAMALLAFAVAVTAAGWVFPTRDIGAVFVGSLTVVGFVSIMIGLLFAGLVQQFQVALTGEFGESADRPDPDRFHNDVYVVLVLTLILVAGWAACSWLSGHVGYRVLILVTVTTVVPLATGALVVEHPSYWGLALGILGAGVLGVVGMRAMGMLPDLGRRRPPPPPPQPGGGPVDLDRPS